MSITDWFRQRLQRFPLAKQFIKFVVVGGTSAIINFTIYTSLTLALDVWYITSSVVAFVVSAVFNFTTNKLWTFRNRQSGHHVVRQLGKYGVVMSLGLLINTGIIYMFTEWYNFDFRISWVFASAMVMFWNFGFNRLWTFRHPKEASDGLSLN